MLVLTRKTQQQIQIGNNIVITILQVKGQAVRVGIEAPRDIRVIRSEINHKPLVRKAVEQETAELETGELETVELETAEPEPAMVEASASRRAAVRVPGEPAAPKPFSSPDAEPLDRTSESHGLFPHMRRLSRQTGGQDVTSVSFERFGGAPSHGLAMRIS